MKKEPFLFHSSASSRYGNKAKRKQIRPRTLLLECQSFRRLHKTARNHDVIHEFDRCASVPTVHASSEYFVYTSVGLLARAKTPRTRQ